MAQGANVANANDNIKLNSFIFYADLRQQVYLCRLLAIRHMRTFERLTSGYQNPK